MWFFRSGHLLPLLSGPIPGFDLTHTFLSYSALHPAFPHITLHKTCTLETLSPRRLDITIYPSSKWFLTLPTIVSRLLTGVFATRQWHHSDSKVMAERCIYQHRDMMDSCRCLCLIQCSDACLPSQNWTCTCYLAALTALHTAPHSSSPARLLPPSQVTRKTCVPALLSLAISGGGTNFLWMSERRS